MPDPSALIAYELHEITDAPLEPAPIARDWMDAAHLRHPYRCLPLVIANQCGWVLRSTAAFRAYWYGGPNKEDVELQFDGPPDNRIVSHFGRNGFFYTLDRTSGKVLTAKPYTKVNWADGIGGDGRPILIAGREPTEEGNLACPGLGGGHNRSFL